MYTPTLRDVYQARKTIAGHIPRTLLQHSSGLSQLLEAEVYLKRDDHLPLGAFKGRGGINMVASLSDEERQRGIITASTGNHGQSIASVCRVFGCRAFIIVPERANPLKVEAMRALGAEVLFHGSNFDQARPYAEELAQREGYRYVHPANEPLLIAGVATQTLEIIEDLPDVQAIFVPLGGGSGAAGACIVAKAVNPEIKIYAVQSEAAPAGFLSWKQGQPVEAKVETFAEGVATGAGYDLPQSILRQHLDDFILVSDDDIRRAICLLIEKAHTLAEGAGATALAGAMKLGQELKGGKLAVVVSGGNITLEHLLDSINFYQGISG